MVLLSGCAIPSRKLGLVSSLSREAASPVGQRLDSRSAKGALGHLVVEIQWPSLGRYRTQVIPDSTVAIALDVLDGGQQLDQVVVERQAGAIGQASFQLPAGNGYQLEAAAYRDEQPGPQSQPIAQGNATGVVVAPNATSTASLTLAPLFAPTIASMSEIVGQAGDAVTISGSNLGVVDGATPSVTFGGLAAAVTPVSSTSLLAMVPSAGVSGPVVVTDDGVPSASQADFWVASGVSITAPKASWDDTPADTRMAVEGSSVAFSAWPTWVLPAGTSAAQIGTPPLASWSSSNAQSGSIGATGVFVPAVGQVGQSTTISARLGPWASNTFTAQVEDVSTISLSPATASLGPGGEPLVPFSGMATMTDGSTNSAFLLSADSPASVSFDATGDAQLADPAGFGPVVVTATSLDPAVIATATVELRNYRIETVAGDGIGGYLGDAGAGTAAELDGPLGVALDASGDLYVTDTTNYVVRRLSPTGTLWRIAGDLITGYNGDDIPAFYAELALPGGIAIDATGDIVFSDGPNFRIRSVDPSGYIHTIAGDGVSGYNGDGIPALEADLEDPDAVSFDASGDLFISDRDNMRIREVKGGIISSVVSSGIGDPYGIAFDAKGNLYISDGSNDEIKRLDPGGTLTVYAGTGSGGYTGDGGLAVSADIQGPMGLAADASGDLFFSDSANNAIRKVSPDGLIGTVAGGGANGLQEGPALEAALSHPDGLAVDASGDVYLADTGNNCVRELIAEP